MSLVDLEEAFDRAPRNAVEWAMIKKEIPAALIRAVMSLFKGARPKEKFGTHSSDELELNAGVHQGSALSPLLFAIVIDVVMNEIKKGMLQEILYAGDIVKIAENMAELQKNCLVRKMQLRVNA